MLRLLYRGLTVAGAPAIRAWLAHRQTAGKEDPARSGERFGFPGRSRPPGRLIWIHGASVGEALSVLSLIDRLLAARSDLSVLMTTGTVTSARLMEHRLPARAFHQFVPVDVPAAAQRFLDFWQPDAVLWLESELWPNLLSEVGRRRIPAALLNGRMSERSFRIWRRWGAGLIQPLLGVFRLCLAQTDDDARRLAALGAESPRSVGNLKFSAPPLPAVAETVSALQAAIGSRPVWLLASSHPGEEILAAEVHQHLQTACPDLLTVLVPRHPERGAAIAATLREQGLRVARRSQGAVPTSETSLFLGDTLGEMGLYYRLAPVVCMGGSFVPHGGQNPIEPAQLGCAILYGPHMFNFREITGLLEAAGAAQPVADAASLGPTLRILLTEPGIRQHRQTAAAAVAARHRHALDTVLVALAPVLAPILDAAPGRDPGLEPAVLRAAPRSGE